MFRAFLPAALLAAAVFGLVSPAWAATTATGHINVSSSGKDLTYSCGTRDTVTVTGSSNDLNFTDTCSTLEITGDANFITLKDLTGSVTLTGGTAFDHVCWDSGSPKIHDSGDHNVVAECHSKTVPAPATARIVVQGHSQDLSYSCGDGETVLVESRSDYLTFTGTCSTLTITSHSNYIILNRVNSVIFSGSTVSDEVCWDSGSPKVHNAGKANVYGKCKS
jgi:hypothetical protein